MGDLALSVVLPCHNPRRDYLERVLAALQHQTLPVEDWELIIVDNASDEPLDDWVRVSWHPKGRLVREKTLGLTHARLRGFRESMSAWIVFVDDDNELAADYLAGVCDVINKVPCLGVFGGSIEASFDETPPSWTKPHWPAIAIRPATQSLWSNDLDHWDSTPAGAGMVVRRDVLARYAEQARKNPLRLLLGRSGTNLTSGEDDDLVMLACSMGLGKGRFRELKLTHLIPASRLEAGYLERLYEGIGYSAVILDAVWQRPASDHIHHGVGHLLKLGWQRLREDWRQRRMLSARQRGMQQAYNQLAEQAHIAPSDRVK